MPEFPDSEPRLNLLAAYPYVTTALYRMLHTNRRRTRWLLDSGAFTAWKAGRSVKVDDYCRFLDSLPMKPWRYFTLDVIGDAAGTMANYETMLKRGFRPIPIFTRGEDPSVIDDYFKTSEVVGIGGLVGTRGNRGFVNGIMRRVGKRWVHWLGFGDIHFLKHYRPYSCDSTTWASARYNVVRLFHSGKTVGLAKRHFRKPPARAVAEAIRSYGFDPEAFSRRANWSRVSSCSPFVGRLNHRSMVRLSLEAQQNLGTLYFHAIASTGDGRQLLNAYDFERSRDAEDPHDPVRRSRQRDAGVLPQATGP